MELGALCAELGSFLAIGLDTGSSPGFSHGVSATRAALLEPVACIPRKKPAQIPRLSLPAEEQPPTCVDWTQLLPSPRRLQEQLVSAAPLSSAF